MGILPKTLALLAALCCVSQAFAQSYTPEHPFVKALVDRGVKYLQSTELNARAAYNAGEQALVAYALLSATGEPDQPHVKRGAEAARRLARSLASYREQGESKIVYEVCVCGVLLANLDAAAYQVELTLIRDWLLGIQKPHGGFGYLERPTGDTSQVQYVILAFWTMQQVGIDVPTSAVESTVGYLLDTMDPTGAWGYQGKLGSGRLIPQENPSKSLGTAGAGALLIAGDILGVWGKRRTLNEEKDGIPAAFVRVDLKAKERQARREVELSRSDFENPLNMARRFQDRSTHSGNTWYYYWRYSQERYESFMEIMAGKQEKSPAWYNEGVEELAAAQDDGGSWGATKKREFYSADVCTAFSVLYLIRSTRKSIGQLDEGVVFGGYGLPQDVTAIKMVGDRIVSEGETSVLNLLTKLEEQDTNAVEVGLLPENLKLDDDPAQRKEQVTRLARLLTSPDPLARRVAAKLLGRSEDLSRAPDLIYALTDDDPHVPMIAEESLRLLSRKLNSGKLQLEPSLADRQSAVMFWKKWYLGLRPDHVFID
ncbi:MAG: hypothetical protein KDB22_13355 [Planctomycetales bacterium]|nr:hypothetical protein [Planctomycetales bacterium]